jgi:hypothetical protein
VITTGITIFLAFWLLWIKLDINTRLKLLAYPFLLDLVVTVAVWFLYGGTGDGIMAATMAAVVMSVNITVARKLFGYIQEDDNGVVMYHKGMLDQSGKIKV